MGLFGYKYKGTTTDLHYQYKVCNKLVTYMGKKTS